MFRNTARQRPDAPAVRALGYHPAMDLVLGHDTALQFLMHRGRQALPAACRKAALPQRAPEARRFARLPEAIDMRGRPLDLIVPDKSLRRDSKLARCHVWSSPLPEGSLIPLGENLFCSSPEFTIVQMAPSLPLAQMIEAIMAMCAIYALDSNGGIVESSPCTSLRRIGAYLMRCRGSYGSALAQRALRYSLERSASPWESKMAICNTLPPREGGYGFAKPILNHPIELGKQALRQTHRRTYVCDEYWGKCRLDLEYDSDGFHSTEQKRREDERRRKVLEYMGVKVISVRPYELANINLYDDIARQIARIMRKRLHVFDAEHRKARIALRQVLFP